MLPRLVLATLLLVGIRAAIDLNTALSHVDELPLPRLVTVNGYHLELQPLIEEGKFKGRVKINVTCKEPTSTITVHADPKLRIVSKPPSEISVKEIVGDEQVISNLSAQVIGTRRDLERQWFTINLAEDLKKSSKYQVELRFAGDLVTDRTDSFFRKSYIDLATGDNRWYAAINMGPTNSRRVFPCFDEPMLKAPIQLSVVRPENMVAVSVMPVNNSRNSTSEPGWVWDTFDTSPVMSTFSFSLLITALPQLATVKVSDPVINIRFFGREAFKPQLTSAINILPKIFEFVQDYFAVDFPLPELNIVALPQYMGAAANHWGLIMFSENSFAEDDNGLWYMGHEIMVQWIGHLVTPHWWNDLRVGSALSQYVTVACMRHTVCPNSWMPSDMYYIYYSYSQPHPFAGGSQENIRKSSNVWFLRMLNFTLGEKTFKLGVQNFVRDRQQETFYEDDIWNALTEQAHLDERLETSMRVETISRTWMSEDRFPVVNVTRDYQKNTAHLQQHIFLRTRPQEGIDQKRVTWWIPVVLLVSDNNTVSERQPITWMRGENEIDIDNLPSEQDFIIINPDEIGMFIVNYDEHNWELLSYYLIDGGHGDSIPLDVGVRVKLLHDAWNLAYGGELTFATALNMTLFLEYENDYNVWQTMLTMVDHVSRNIEDVKVGEKFQEYFRRLIIPFYEKLGPKEIDEPKKKEQVRASAQHFLCSINYKPCIEISVASFDKWMQETDPDAGNPLSHAAMCHVLQWGTMEQWKFALHRLFNLPSNRTRAEQSDMIRALAGCPKQPEKIELFLNITILEANSNFTESDVRLALNMLTGDSIGYTTLFNFLVNNWDAVKQRYDGKPHMWEYVINIAVGSFKTQEGLDLINELYADKKGQFGTAEQIILEKTKKVIEEAKWSNAALPVMEAWLDDRLTQEIKF